MNQQLSTAIALCVLAGSVAPAQAQVACGETITTPEVLTSNLTCTMDFPALTIQGPDGSLDMRGFTLSCGGSEADGIALIGEGAQLEDGTVTACSDGVRLQGTNGRVEGMTVENNTDVGVFISEAGSGNQVRETISRNNRDDGFSDFSIGGNTFERNRAAGNEINGFQIGSNASGNTLRGNVATNNLARGFEIANDNHLVTANVARNNERDGFQIRDSNNRLTLNLARSNLEDGIDVENGATNNRLTLNAGFGNGSADLEGNGGFDLEDDNPNCDNNIWRLNVGTRNQDCIR